MSQTVLVTGATGFAGGPVLRAAVAQEGLRAIAAAMEALDPLVPWEPLVTRSIVHLLRETGATNDKAARRIGFRPEIGWREAIAVQMAEMRPRGGPAMAMSRPLS